MNALRHFAVDKVAWRLLHCDLSFDCRWHMVAIPVKTTAVVPIEEMDFAAGRSDIRMQSNEFKQCPRSTLLHANYQHFGQMTIELHTLLLKETILWIRQRIAFIQCHSSQRDDSHNRAQDFDFGTICLICSMRGRRSLLQWILQSEKQQLNFRRRN